MGLFKRGESLCVLNTDIGFQDSAFIWEQLDGVDGDTHYVGHDFSVPPPNSNSDSREEEARRDLGKPIIKEEGRQVSARRSELGRPAREEGRQISAIRSDLTRPAREEGRQVSARLPETSVNPPSDSNYGVPLHMQPNQIFTGETQRTAQPQRTAQVQSEPRRQRKRDQCSIQ